MNHTERPGNPIGQVIVIRKADLARIGHSWMKGRVQVGDVALSTAHAGDCFNRYALISVSHNAIRLILESEFGAYRIGEPTKWQPSAREFHLLMAGEMLAVNPSYLSTKQDGSGLLEPAMHPLRAELGRQVACG